MISEHGVGGATHRAVAASAGVPLAATTYYFASRDDLIGAAFDYLTDAEIDELESGVNELPQRMSVELAAAMITSIVADDLRKHRDRIRAEHEMHLEAGRNPRLRATHRRWSEAAMKFFTAAMTAAGSSHPTADAALVLSVVSGIQLGELADPSAQLERDLLGPLMRRLLHSLIP